MGDELLVCTQINLLTFGNIILSMHIFNLNFRTESILILKIKIQAVAFFSQKMRKQKPKERKKDTKEKYKAL